MKLLACRPDHAVDQGFEHRAGRYLPALERPVGLQQVRREGQQLVQFVAVQAAEEFAFEGPGASRLQHLAARAALLEHRLRREHHASAPGDPADDADRFVAGVDDRPTLTTHDGWQRGIQIDLSPMAVRALFGVSMHALTKAVVGLDDLLPTRLRSLPEQLQHLDTWDARFDRVERWLADGLGDLGLVERDEAADRFTDRRVYKVAWKGRRKDKLLGSLTLRRIVEELKRGAQRAFPPYD